MCVAVKLAVGRQGKSHYTPSKISAIDTSSLVSSAGLNLENTRMQMILASCCVHALQLWHAAKKLTVIQSNTC